MTYKSIGEHDKTSTQFINSGAQASGFQHDMRRICDKPYALTIASLSKLSNTLLKAREIALSTFNADSCWLPAGMLIREMLLFPQQIAIETALSNLFCTSGVTTV